MCGSMVDIQSPAAEIRRGKKGRKIVTTGQKYNGPLFHKAAITSRIYIYNSHPRISLVMAKTLIF